MAFDWTEKLFEGVVGAVPALHHLLPEHVKRQALARLADHNPFAHIKANADLLRALRLAWIEAALDVDKVVRAQTPTGELGALASRAEQFSDLVRGELKVLRSDALNRELDPGHCAIDRHLRTLLCEVPRYIAIAGNKTPGQLLTDEYLPILCELTGWSAPEVPAIFEQVARQGLPHKQSEVRRAFGELVYSAFSEIVKDPSRYAQASSAFNIAIAQAIKELVEQTLRLASGTHEKLDLALARLAEIQNYSSLEGYGQQVSATLASLNRIEAEVRAVHPRLDALEDQIVALAGAQGQQFTDKLEAIAAELNARQGQQHQEQAFSIGVVQAFLASIRGKHVPLAEWPQTFGELTRQFLVLGERIQSTPVTSDRIKRLVELADNARKLGRLEEADQELATAEGLATEEAKKHLADLQSLRDQAQASTRQAASLVASRASIAFARLERAAGAALLERAFEIRALDPSTQSLWWLFEAGDAWVLQGQTSEALRLYAKGRTSALGQIMADPGNTEWQRDLSVSHERIGNVQRAQGDLGAALASFEAAIAIRQKLATADPGNTEWQRDLSVSHNMIGNVQQAQGDLGAALASFEAAMAIAQKLATADPGNTEWQRDLSVSHERIGNVQQAQGDLGAALASFEAAIAIAQKLATADPGNTQWQRDLSVSHNMIGNVQQAQGDLGAALASFQAAMAIAQKLATADPGNTEWQRDLSVSHNKIGNVQQAQGDLGAALASFEAAMAIRQKLATADPGNTEWQRDLSVSHNKIGNVQQAQGDLGAALASFQAAMAIAKKLVTADPGNAGWQLDHAVACWKVHTVTAAESVVERQRLLTEGLASLKGLETSGKLPVRARGWAAMFEGELAQLG